MCLFIGIDMDYIYSVNLFLCKFTVSICLLYHMHIIYSKLTQELCFLTKNTVSNLTKSTMLKI